MSKMTEDTEDTEDTEAQELAFAWASVGMPLEVIADMHIKLQERIKELEKEI